MPFPVSCPACGKSFSISDDVYEQKIKGRVVSVKCKQCQAAIRVDGTKAAAGTKGGAAPTNPPPAAPGAVAAPEPARPSAAAPVPAAPAPAAAAPPPAAPAPAAAAPPPAARGSAGRGAGAPAPAAPVAAAAAPAAAQTPKAPAVNLAATSPATPVAMPAAARSSAAAAGQTPRTAAAGAARPAATTATAKGAGGATFNRARDAAETPAAAPVAPPVSEVPEPLLYAVDSPGGDRELTVEQIAAEIASGSITAETLVWRDGMAEWLEVQKVPELAKHLKPPEPARPAPKPPAGEAAAEAVKGFRPRLPTLPMGVLPNQAGATKTGAASQSREPREARPPSVGGAPKSARGGPVTPAPEEKPAAAALPRPAAAAPIPVRVEPAARAPIQAASTPLYTPDMGDEEPTVLRSPEAIAALLNAADEHTPAATPVADAAQRQDAGRLPPLPPRGVGAFEKLPPFETPEPTPPKGAAWEVPRAAFDSGPPPPPPPVPRAPQPSSSASSAIASSGPTSRESPEAKRAWFPDDSDFGPRPTPPPTGPVPPFGPSPSALPAASPAAPLVGRSPAPAAAVSGGTARPGPAAFPVPASFDEDLPFRPKRRTGLWVTLLLLLLAGLGAAYFFFFARKPPAMPVTVPTSTAEPLATAATSSPTAESTARAPAAEPARTSGDSDVAGPGSGSLPGRAPASSGSAFADLFAAGAKHAEVDGVTARFDPRAAKAALDGLMGEAARCRERGGPTGITRIVVTFEPSGSVANAVVSDAPLAGTTTGNCISGVMKRATIRPFSGQPGTVTQRISIQ